MKKTDVSQEKVLIGKAGSPVGIRGEFRVTMYSGDTGNLKEGKVLLLERADKKVSKGTVLSDNSGSKRTALSDNSGSTRIETTISRVRFQNDRPVVKLKGIDDRNAAEEIRGMEISIRACDLEELPEGEHYVRDLIGFRVIDVSKRTVSGDNSDDSTDGTEIGVLADVIQNTAQSILDVRTAEGKSVLIPAVDAFLKSIDEEAGVIEVELIPGFLE